MFSGAVGLALGLFGLALALNAVSLRTLMASTGVGRAARLTWELHDVVTHDGAQGVEAAMALTGMSVLVYALWRATRPTGRGPRLGRLRRARASVSPTTSRWLAGGSIGAALLIGLVLLLATVLRLQPFAMGAPAEGTDVIDVEQDSYAGNQGLLPGEHALIPGDLRLTETFNSVGMEMLFSGDTNGNATASVKFKKSTESAWRTGLPLWRTDDATSPGPAFYGSILLLDAGAPYDVQVTLRDPDGVRGESAFQQTVTTRTEDIPAPGDLIPTRFVRVEGDDTSDGLTRRTAWRSIAHALAAAPDGAVVQVGPGEFAAPGDTSEPGSDQEASSADAYPLTRSAPVTIIAEYPAVDDKRNVINVGLHTVLEPAAVSSPKAAGDEANHGVWTQVTLDGPGLGAAAPDATYTVWMWPDSPVDGATQLGYAASRAALPQRLASWEGDDADLSTPNGWAEKLYTNQRYNYGFYTVGRDIYARFPGDVDPNELYVTAGSGDGLNLDGPNIRVSGLEIRQFERGIAFGPDATSGVVDHCLLSGNRYGVFFEGDPGPPPVYGGDHVIQFDRFVDSNLRTDDQTGRPAIPLFFIRARVRNADDSVYPHDQVGGQNNTVAVSGDGGATRVVVRRNTIDGTFTGIRTGYQDGYDRYAGMDMDVDDNLIQNVTTNAIETNASAINLRIWGNRIEHVSVALATDLSQFGPIYFFRNEAWQVGGDGVGRDARGRGSITSAVFMYSAGGSPPARVFILHNTFWSGQPKVSGGDRLDKGTPSNESIYLRNNLFRVTRYAFDANGLRQWNEDYDVFSTSDPTQGITYKGRRFRDDVAEYRAASGQGWHTNASGSFVSPLTLKDPEHGDLGLPDGSPFIDAGTPVPNVSDRPQIDFRGSAPDLGASER